MTNHDQHELVLLLARLDAELEREGAPKSRRRFLEDVQMSIDWINKRKEKK